MLNRKQYQDIPNGLDLALESLDTCPEEKLRGLCEQLIIQIFEINESYKRTLQNLDKVCQALNIKM